MDKILFTDGPASPPNADNAHQKYKAAELPAVATPIKAVIVADTPK